MIIVALNLQKVSDRVEATWKALLRALKLFLLGVFLQGIISNSHFGFSVSHVIHLLVHGTSYNNGMQKLHIYNHLFTVRKEIVNFTFSHQGYSINIF